MDDILLPAALASVVRRHGRASQDVVPKPFRVIDIVSNRVPKLRRVLPFVNQAGLLASKQFRDVNGGLHQITVAAHGVGHVENALRQLLAGRRLATPFRAFNENGASPSQFPRQNIVKYAFPIIFLNFHGESISY